MICWKSFCKGCSEPEIFLLVMNLNGLGSQLALPIMIPSLQDVIHETKRCKRYLEHSNLGGISWHE